MSPARVGFNAPSSKNSRLIFAQQPRPNDKRNPLLHVLRTAGTAGRLREGPCGKAEAEQGPVERGQNAEVRGQERHRRGGRRAKRGGRGGERAKEGTEGGARGRGRGEGARTALSTPAQGRWMGREGGGGGKTPKGGRWFYLQPGALWRGQNAEVGGQGKPEQPEQPLRSASAATEQPHGRTRTDTDRHGRREVSG
jgi:hypothetical protein